MFTNIKNNFDIKYDWIVLFFYVYELLKTE